MDVVLKLRDDNEYYGGIGKMFLSNSDIGSLLDNPKEFGRNREDTKEFMLGRYFHLLILEPEKASRIPIVDVSSRNTNAYKDFLASTGHEIALLLREAEEVHEWVSTIKGNLDFFGMISDPNNLFEQPAVGMIAGEMWKGKADIVGTEFVYDLKTTGDIHSFRWNARKYNYDSQAYIYQQLFGKPMVFLVIDKNSRMLGQYTVSEATLESGRKKVQDAVKTYRMFFGDNPSADINQYFYHEEI